MAIIYQKKVAVFKDTIAVEEADGLLEWLIKNTNPQVNLRDCFHLHAANLQVLMTAKPTITAWPKDANLCVWLKSALTTN